MRKLLRGRHGTGTRIRLIAPVTVAVAVACLCGSGLRSSAEGTAWMIHITSPLGRTGLPGTIRVVARLDGVAPSVPVKVHFYVDKLLLASDVDGPPFEALWTDENPFEKRELMAEAEFGDGLTLTDRVELKPLEVTDSAEITSVTVEASVLDTKGRFISNLSAGNFRLLENDEPQTVDLVAQQREAAMFTLLVDSSQSMAIRSEAVRSTAANFLKSLAPEDQVIVAPFSRGVNAVTGPTTDRATVLGAIAAIRHRGGTAILDTLADAADRLEGGERRKAMVLITDGYDEDSQSSFDAAVKAMRKRDVTLYVIGFGGVAGISLKGEKLLTHLAEETGGRAWFPLDEQRLRFAYDAIAADVQHKYVLTYTPQNQKRDGSWRAITVTAGEGLRVRARKGYTAPLAPPVRTSLEFTGIGAGQTPLSLTRDDVTVLEDGIPQQVDTFHEAVLPVTFMLALDSSGSMKKSATQAQEAARDFIAAMRPEDQLGMILFSTKSNYINSPTDRRDYSLKAIDSYVAEGGTALYDALYDSLAQVATAKGRRAVVVVTDGRDENATSDGPGSLRTWEDVLRLLPQSEAAVYAVGIGSSVDRSRLQELADRSGGVAYFPSDVAALAGDYNKILDELRRRYVIGYESTNRLRNGEWRKVDIRVHQEGASIRSRGGYYAPTQ